MKEYELEQVVRLSRMLPKESAYTIAVLYKRLRKLAARLSTIDIHHCNGTRYTSHDEVERAHASVYKVLAQTEKEYGVWTYHQKDPHGASLYVDIAPREYYTEALAITAV